MDTIRLRSRVTYLTVGLLVASIGAVGWAELGSTGTVLGCVGASGIIRGVDEATGACKGGDVALAWYTKAGADNAFLSATSGAALAGRVTSAENAMQALRADVTAQAAALAGVLTDLTTATARLTALEASAPRTLTVNTAGDGAGTVAGEDGEINCGADCNEVYPSGAVVTLAAVAQTGSTFAGWSGDCGGTGPCTLTLDGARNATAHFNVSPAPPPGPCPGGTQYVVHNNGLGHTWTNCTPLNTYSQAAAIEAALAYNPGGSPTDNFCGGLGGGQAVIIENLIPGGLPYIWQYTGQLRGRVTIGVCASFQEQGGIWG